jgi:glycosyltransferase involved in cell wall biosynthesis
LLRDFVLTKSARNDEVYTMKVALVHDYIKEYGGAERVLEALCELYPDAPIYTAFYNKNSHAYERFKGKKIIASWAQHVPFFATKLHSPLRFLAPLIWGSFNFSTYDVVISSASWYVTKGFGRRHSGERSDSRIKNGSWTSQDDKDKRPIEICYCHTPPRWLYGYKTAVELQKYLPVKIYAAIVGHFMRLYDFQQAQKVDYFIANSKEVKGRIKKFYRRDAEVIYPPVSLQSTVYSLRPTDYGKQGKGSAVDSRLNAVDSKTARSQSTESYYFIVARLAGPKGIDIAVKAAAKAGFKLKIAGAPTGYGATEQTLKALAGNTVEFLGHVSDEELVELYTHAKAFLALGTDEDFGITPVEAMLCGTPVVAYNGGGYRESVVDGKTGVFFDESTEAGLLSAIQSLEKLHVKPEDCKSQAEKFSKDRFKKQIHAYIEEKLKLV